MVVWKLFIFIGCILHTQSVQGVFWGCTQDSDCADVRNSVCEGNSCVCPPGRQSVAGGTSCAEAAPYYTSQCVEDFQCSGLFTGFQCRRSTADDEVGNCFCRPGNHYFRGRCWPSAGLGEACTRDEQCQGAFRDPFSMSCNGVCECAEGYYLRQRGECRRIGAAVGDGCVVDEDCRFEGGACNLADFSCYDRNAGEPASYTYDLTRSANISTYTQVRNDVGYGSVCNATNSCAEPLICTGFGVCHCPIGYYPDASQSICLAELGSPVDSAEQCVGVFTEVRDGICSCQANFFFNEDMRTCAKASRFLTDGCLSDINCHTFGAHAHCGAPQQWGLRSCECDLNETVWDADRRLCRLFAGIGEVCEVDDDCVAGDLVVSCVEDSQGQRRCECPEGYITQEGMCLTLGLFLGDSCQLSMECTGTANSICSENVCSCDFGYQRIGDICVPALGGSCEANTDCVIEDTVCSSTTNTCQCDDNFVEAQETCWERATGFGAACNVSQQCISALGSSAVCDEGVCGCAELHHYRDEGCWPQTGLFEGCSRSSQCFLGENSHRVHCRNSICQCTFDFPYDEELGTCRSSAASIFGNSMIIATALFYLFSR